MRKRGDGGLLDHDSLVDENKHAARLFILSKVVFRERLDDNEKFRFVYDACVWVLSVR